MKIIKTIKSQTPNTKVLVSVILIILVLAIGTLAYTANRNEVNTVAPQQYSGVQEKLPESEVATPEVKNTTPAVVEQTKVSPPIVEPSPNWPALLTNAQASSLTVVVNKKHKLPNDYVPDLTPVTGGQMRPEAAQAMTSMLFKANESGVPMKVISSYRSYSTQVSTYNKWVAQSGQAQADTFSARPGHSEHQTGLAADLGMPDGSCNLEICFGNTAQGKWLAENAASYGFIIRYESDAQSITGYQYEPWHIRYVGVDVATAVVNSGQTLDQYYGVEAGGY